MNIKSAQFIKGVRGTDPILEDGTAQIAFIGRSNVGKSSVINSLTNQEDLAKTSSFPGRTQEINIFLINNSFYLVDLPGYGYAKIAGTKREQLRSMLNWYFFDSDCVQKKVVLIIDGDVGPTRDDLDMLRTLEDYDKNIIIVANKVDKIAKKDYDHQIKKIQIMVGNHKVIPYSATEFFGIGELADEIAR